jgi:hypothetical protein
MSTLVTEAFGGTLSNWSGPGSPATYCSITSGELVFSGEGGIRHNTSCGTANKWLRLRLPTLASGGIQHLVIGSNSSGDFASVAVTSDTTYIQLADVSHYTTYTTWVSDEGLSPQGTGITFNSAQYIGLTLDKTGKVVRFWNNVTAAAPDSVTSWDSRAADATQTFTGTVPGDYIGFASTTSSPTNVKFDDLTAGDFAAGGGVEATPGAGQLTAAGLAPTRLVNYARVPGAGALDAVGFAPTFLERGLRYAYPTTDTSAGAWTPSTGTDLWAMIDEATPSDTDYIVTNTAGKCKLKLLPVTDPASSSGHVINYRIWSPITGNAVVRLIQGASTLIAEWTHTGLPATATTYSQVLTSGQADSITNYDDLYIEFEAT